MGRKILITGAGGFIGQFLARELLKDSTNTLILTDITDFSFPRGAQNSENATIVRADLCVDTSVVQPDLDAVYILHGIMSAGSEADFELGLRVNLEATKNLLIAISKGCPGIKVIYTSAGAVYGQPLPDVIDESVVPTPQSSYGGQKLMCEMLINDLTRRGKIDGLSLRLPSISVRPGKPTAAASSFISGIIREPLDGKECIVPLKDRAFPSWVCAPNTLMKNLLHALELPRDCLPAHKRSIVAPGCIATVQDMRDALAAVAGEDKLQYIKEVEDPELSKILHSWAWNYDCKLALSLGFRVDSSFEKAVREYVAYLEEEKRWAA
jgi:nucleoside-diphosphate-sugar epimerase